MAAIRTQREIRQRASWWFVGLLVASFALMSYNARDESTNQRKVRSLAQMIAYPIQRGASGIGGWFGGVFGSIGHLRGASAENQMLREQIAQMQTALRDAQQRASEAERLEKLLKLNESVEYKTIVAQVVGRDPSMWFDSVQINKGRWAGIEVNMPVITGDGIVGRVVSTSPWSAQVMLATDEIGRAHV